MKPEKCYICGRNLDKRFDPYEVILEDDDFNRAPVGPDCFERVVKSGYDGVRSGKGKGSMVFVTTAMAQTFARHKATRS